MLVPERIFPPQRKLTVGILSGGAGLSSRSDCGQKEQLHPVLHTLTG